MCQSGAVDVCSLQPRNHLGTGNVEDRRFAEVPDLRRHLLPGTRPKLLPPAWQARQQAQRVDVVAVHVIAKRDAIVSCLTQRWQDDPEDGRQQGLDCVDKLEVASI